MKIALLSATLLFCITFTACDRKYSKSFSSSIGDSSTSGSWSDNNTSGCISKVKNDSLYYEVNAEAKYDLDALEQFYVDLEVSLETDSNDWEIYLTEKDLEKFYSFNNTKSFALSKIAYHPSDDSGFMTLAIDAKINEEPTSIHLPFKLENDQWKTTLK